MAASGIEALEANLRRHAILDGHREDIPAEFRMRGLAVKTIAILLNGHSWKSRSERFADRAATTRSS